MPKPTHLAALGVATEVAATPGIPAAPTMWVPWKTCTPKDIVNNSEDKGIRGAPVEVYGIVQGQKGSTLDLGGDVFADSIGHVLAGILGDIVVTGAAAPYATAFSVLCTGDTQAVSKTWTIVDPNLGAWQYPGVRLNEVTFKWNADGLLEWSGKGDGWAFVTLASPPAPAQGSLRPFANWSILTKLAGVQIGVLDGELNIKRKVDVIRAANGSQNPVSVWGGDISVEGKLTTIMEDSTQRAAYQASTVQSLDVSCTQGAGATANGLALHCSQIYYPEATPSPSKEYWELPITFKAIANAADAGASGGYSPIKATLTNALPSGTYK
ncbi:phage tail tube protein [Kitasatospora mediocidica]|uniref:phage tail tube protein n=1 Tax=Kitasatospora mediocidica TaxID=58352 RepID=UPI000560601E